jgi:hypothetical protein
VIITSNVITQTITHLSRLRSKSEVIVSAILLTVYCGLEAMSAGTSDRPLFGGILKYS